jgi:hypothetical protein
MATAPIDDDLEDLPDLDDDNEEGDDEEEEEREPPPQPEGASPRRGPGRPRKSPSPRTSGVGATPTPQAEKYQWRNRDVENLWPEILHQLAVHYHRPPHDVDIRVKRMEPQEMLLGQPFNGGTVAGSEGQAASTQIVNKITDEYHMVSGCAGPASYKIEFIWRANSQVLKWGIIKLPSPDAIMAVRQQQARLQQQQAYASPMMPPQYPGSYPAPPYGQQPPYQGFGAPQAQATQAPQGDAAMRAELGYLRGTLDEVLRAQREGRQPSIQPPPPAPGEPISEDRIVARVVEALRASGAIGMGAPPPAPPPAAPPPAATATDQFQQSVQSIMQTMVQGALKRVASNVESAFRGEGLGAAPAEAVAEVVPEEKPEDLLPFRVVPVPESKWPDGRPVNFARKPDGNIDYQGALMSNPFIMEKLGDAAAGLVGSVSEVIKGIGRASIPTSPQGPHVVNHIPRGAVHAGVSHPQPVPQPQAAPQAATAPPARGGWPTEG